MPPLVRNRDGLGAMGSNQMPKANWRCLLTLLSQRADRGLVMVKVEELHGLVESLFTKRQSQTPLDIRNQ